MNRPIAVTAFVVVCVVAYMRLQAPPARASDPMNPPPQGQINVPLNAQNGSGQSGMATLTSTGDGKTQVVIALNNASVAPEPAHLHHGSCARLDPKPAYPLKDVVGGASTTIVPVTLAALETGNYSINVHQSASNLGVYVACGTIPAPMNQPMNGSGGSMGTPATPSPMGT